MRKVFLGMAFGLLILPVIGGAAFAAAGGIRIAVSILPQAYFVERAAGNRAAVHVMIPKGASPETYEPTPQQLVALSDSKLYIKVGSPNFPFEQKYLQTVLGQNRKITIVNMSDGAPYRKEDPHVWTSPAATRIAAQNIARALEAYDPPHREEYRNHLNAFLDDIDKLDRGIKRSLTGKKGYAFMVFHPAWGYFADEYGLKQLAIEEEGKPASAAHIRKMVDLARKKGIRTVLVQRGFDTKSARAIARDIDGEIVETDPLERNWLAGMRHFTTVLEQALRK